MHHQPSHHMMQSPHHSNNQPYPHSSIPPQPLPAGVYHDNLSNSSPVKHSSQPPSLHNTPSKHLPTIKTSLQQEDCKPNILSPGKNLQMLPPSTLEHNQTSNMPPLPSLPSQPIHLPTHPTNLHSQQINLTSPSSNASQQPSNIPHQQPLSSLQKPTHFQNTHAPRTQQSFTPQSRHPSPVPPLTFQPGVSSLKPPLPTIHTDNRDLDATPKDSDGSSQVVKSVITSTGPVPVDVPLKLNISSGSLASPQISPCDSNSDNFNRLSARQLVSPALPQRSPHPCLTSPRKDSNSSLTAKSSPPLQYHSPTNTLTLERSKMENTPVLKKLRSLSPVITPLSIVEEEEEEEDEQVDAKEKTVSNDQDNESSAKDKNGLSVSEHSLDTYEKQNKPVLHRMVSAPG